MTIAELISIADELVANPFSTGIKLMLVNEIEGRIQHDVFRVDPDEVEHYTTSDISNGTALLLGAPWQQVYVSWMKTMYYWHMAEYDHYENEMVMFNNEWTRLGRTVSEARSFGTSEPPVWQVLLPSRYLPGRVVLNSVTYDADESSWSSDQTFEQLTAQIAQGYWVVCRVSGVNEGEIYWLPLVQEFETVLAFATTQEWHNGADAEYRRAVLWIQDTGAINWRYEES